MVKVRKGLEARIKLLEDIEAIKKLKARYTYAVDQQRGDEVMACFAEECSADFGAFGKYETRKDVEKFYQEIVPSALSFTLHHVHNPLIQIEGDTAQGKWYFEIPATHAPSNRAIWLAGVYEDEFVREKGEWKYKRLTCSFSYVTGYDEGWAKKRMTL